MLTDRHSARFNRDRRKASAATELAILLPFISLMFLAALDFGRVYQASQILQQCASAAASYASNTSKTTAATGNITAATNAAIAAGASLSPPLQASDVTTTIDSSAGTATVTIQYDFTMLTSLIASNGVVHLTRTVVINRAPVPG